MIGRPILSGLLAAALAAGAWSCGGTSFRGAGADDGCYEGDFSIKSAADVARLRRYGCVTGSLFIQDSSGLTSLDGLDNLVSVGGFLWIRGNPELADLGGLDNLVSVDGDLGIISNPALESLGGLGGLASTASLHIQDNPALRDLRGLDGLASVSEELWIDGNPALPQCEACRLLQRLGGFEGDVEFHGNRPDTCSDTCD